MSASGVGPSVAEMSPRALFERLSRKESTALLDVREPRERDRSAISVGAGMVDLYIPMNQVPARLEEIRDVSSRAMLVVYCHHGVRSLMVAEWLVGQGLESVQNLGGGIDAWSREVDAGVPLY